MIAQPCKLVEHQSPRRDGDKKRLEAFLRLRDGGICATLLNEHTRFNAVQKGWMFYMFMKKRESVAVEAMAV